MIKVGKRNRDFEMGESPSTHCSPLKLPDSLGHGNPEMETTPRKLRNRDYFDSPKPFQLESPFVSQSEDLKFNDLIPSRKLKQKNKPEEILFTYDQVKDIVARALADREQQLRTEYDLILQERLQEQFKNFAKFNEDYISRQLKQSDWSYLS
jgi:hypothetical protein